MNKVKWLLPLFLAVFVIASGFGFVKYYNGYEKVGEHWAPKSPIAHEAARFATDMGAEGDYLISIEKLSSKLSLFFVEYQTAGAVLNMNVYSDDGIVRLNYQFADEGEYRITVQHTIHPNHHEIIDFTVQTPLVKYTNDVLLFGFLWLAGFFSGKRLKGLAMICLVVVTGSISAPQSAQAHGMGGGQELEMSNQVDGIKLAWLKGHSPIGEANRTPMDWRMKLTQAGTPVTRAPFSLDFVHLESGFPVLHIEGVAKDGLIDLHYSPPDGTAYQLQVRTVIDGRVYHLALKGKAEAIRPTSERKWSSFLLMMIPVLLGMAWGWRRGKHG